MGFTFNLGDRVCSVLDITFEGLITAITLKPGGVLYEVSCIIEGTPGCSSFYEFEIQRVEGAAPVGFDDVH